MTDTLDKLKKAFDQAIRTASIQPWNEPLTRRDSVQSGQVLAPVVQGGLGSWVASSGFPYTGVTADGVQTGTQPPARNLTEMGIGLPGVPDIDFVPYAARTNRFGAKGPALLGHPISWEVVGPTLKSPFCDWQWFVHFDDNTLTLEEGPFPLLGAVPTVAEAYGLTGTISDYDELGGLYVLFSFTGEGFDGSLAGGRTVITPSSGNFRAPYEIFRVSNFAGQVLTLASSKRVVHYYGAGDGCRAITLIRPKVTRLAAFPASGLIQANRVFVFMPPETSATSELMPPFDDGATGSGTWLGGGFDVSGTIPAGDPARYGAAVKLPIPKPIARILCAPSAAGPFDADTWEIQVAVVTSAMDTLVPGRVVRVSSVVDTVPSLFSDGAAVNCYGFFEITAFTPGAPNVITLRRVPEVNPDTGAVFFGNGPVGTGPQLEVEVFDSITSFFEDEAVSFDKLAAARLQNIIDPRSVGSSLVLRDQDEGMVSPSKADRAIFDTRPGVNPGNLLDLGFRAVFFPAKDLGGQAVPDFDRPIDAHDVVLDPSVNERQYIEVDYAGGVIYLSRTPVPGAGCDVAPDIATFSSANNPRQEIVLFASCVPYSLEEGQAGGGLRIMASSPEAIAAGFGEHDLADVFGRRIILELDGAQTLTPGPGPESDILTTLSDLSEIPPSGFFFVCQSAGGTILNRLGPYYYQYTDLNPTVRLRGITGTGAIALDPAAGWRIVLQRSLRSFAPEETSADTVRGSSKRVPTLGFKNAAIEVGADGSVTIDATGGVATLDDAYRSGHGSPGSGRVILADGGAVEVRSDGSSPSPDFISDENEALIRARTDVGTTTDTSVMTGVEFIGRRAILSPSYTGMDDYAGFLDRRIFAPGSGYTVLDPSFDIDIVGADQIQVTTGGNQFHDGGATNRTLIHNGQDLIHIPGFGLFVLDLQVPGTATDYTLREIDGTVPSLTVTSGIKGCTVYRPRFATSRSHNEQIVVDRMGGSWFMSTGPKPTLRLFAGSSSVLTGPDEGGSTRALQFVYRRNASIPVAQVEFDTYGRLVSTLRNDHIAADDLAHRGAFVTRSRRTLGGDLSISHIVENVAGVGAPTRGFDFLSLHSNQAGLSSSSFSFTVESSDTIRVSTLNFSYRRLAVAGGALVDITSYVGAPASEARGLYRIVGVSNPSGAANTGDIQLIRLDGSAPVLVPSDSGTGNFFTASFLGFGQSSYTDMDSVVQSHQPSAVIGVNSVNNQSLGLHISGPDPLVVSGAAAIRVTSIQIAGGAPFEGTAVERFRVGLNGSVRAASDIRTGGDIIADGDVYGGNVITTADVIAGGEFLYQTPPSRTTIVSFVGEMAAYGANWSRGGANDEAARFLVGGSVNATTTKDMNAELVEGSTITALSARVNATASDFTIALYYVTRNFAAVASVAPTLVAQGVSSGAGWQTVSLGAGLPHTVAKGPSAGVGRDYFLLIKANPSATGDEVHAISMTFTDPGPRNT